jgi:hypothetical protein
MKFTLPWGSRQATDAIERTKVLTRMHASNYVSTVHANAMPRAAEDHAKARFRIAKKLWQTPTGGKNGADDVLKLIIQLLQTSELTINFKVDSFFFRPIKGRTYGNCYELARGTGAAQLKERDKAENKLFSYAKPTVVTDKRYGATSGQTVATSIAKHGVADLDAKNKVTNPDFLPGMRPKYAAVNFQKCPKGAAFKYGNESFVLKSHMKFNATYTHFDSYTYRDRADDGPPNERATYHNMAPIVRYMTDGMLDVLIKEATGQKVGPIGFASYIEAQIHGDIEFARDVDRIVIPSGPQSVNEPARGNLLAFANQFSLKIASA